MNTGYGPVWIRGSPSFDMTVQALTGIMARLGEPGEPPIYLGMGSGDAYGGLMSALGILIALHSRRRTGEGPDARRLALRCPALSGGARAPGVPRDRAIRSTREQQSRSDRPQPLRNAFRARDGWIVSGARRECTKSWSRLCGTCSDDEALAGDTRFADAPAKRRRNGKALVARASTSITRAMSPAKEWIASRWQRRRASGLPEFRTFEDLAADPQAWQNRYLMTTHCEEVDREVDIRGLPIGLSETPGSVEKLGPELGGDIPRSC